MLIALLVLVISSNQIHDERNKIKLSYLTSQKIKESSTNCDEALSGSTQISNDSNSIPQNTDIYGCNVEFNHQIRIEQSRLLLYSCVFEKINDQQKGGAINIQIQGQISSLKGDYIMKYCIIRQCKAKWGGALMINVRNQYVRFRFTNSTFEDNVAEFQGGAIYASLNYPIFDCYKFINNIAPSGADIYLLPLDVVNLDDLDTVEEDFTITNSIFERSLFNDNSNSIFYIYDSFLDFTFSNNIVNISNVDQDNLNIVFFDFSTSYLSAIHTSDNCLIPYDKVILTKNEDFYKKINFDKDFAKYKIEPTETKPFSISSYFSESVYFSGSSHFTRSSSFSKSSPFTASSSFTASFPFTSSSLFSKSNEFSSSLTTSKLQIPDPIQSITTKTDSSLPVNPTLSKPVNPSDSSNQGSEDIDRSVGKNKKGVKTFANSYYPIILFKLISN